MKARSTDYHFAKFGDYDFTNNQRMITICGQQYRALSYDTYIYQAIRLAAKWQPEEITYQRIVYLRAWIRENIQHAHDIYLNPRTMQGCKKWIDKVINAEYNPQFAGDDLEYKKMLNDNRELALQQNAEIFSSTCKIV